MKQARNPFRYVSPSLAAQLTPAQYADLLRHHELELAKEWGLPPNHIQLRAYATKDGTLVLTSCPRTDTPYMHLAFGAHAFQGHIEHGNAYFDSKLRMGVAIDAGPSYALLEFEDASGGYRSLPYDLRGIPLNECDAGTSRIIVLEKSLIR